MPSKASPSAILNADSNGGLRYDWLHGLGRGG